MQILDYNILRHRLPQLCCIIYNILRFHQFTFFNHRANNVGLMSHTHLLLDEMPCRPAITCADRAVFNRQSFCWQFIDHRNIQISIKYDCQCSRYRCGAHNHDVWRLAFFRQKFSLPHAKTMLFIGDYKSETAVIYFFLNDCMCPYNNICFMIFYAGISLPFFFGRHRACQQCHRRLSPVRQHNMLKVTHKRFKMLFGQHFRRCHQTALITGIAYFQQRKLGDHRLSRTYIPLDKPVHDFLRSHIFTDFLPCPHLSIGQRISQILPEAFTHSAFTVIRHFIKVCCHFMFFFQTAYSQRE